MSVLVVGSVALDSIETHSGGVQETLGGSATHFSLASCMLAQTRLVAVVGDDMPVRHMELLREHGVDLTGMKICEGKKTFRWTGRYARDMDARETIAVELNVFGEMAPEVPPQYKDSEFVFLANGAPRHQMKVLDEVNHPVFTAVDTMDHWVVSERSMLMELFRKVDAVIVNDSEAELLTKEHGVAAAEAILDMGPKYVIIKKGAHGAVMVGQGQTFLIPAYPTPAVRDPTGAGDSFAGGMMGYLAKAGNTEPETLRTAVAYGTVLASFNVEDFGVNRVVNLAMDEVEERLDRLSKMIAFQH